MRVVEERTGHWGTGDLELSLTCADELEAVKPLLQCADLRSEPKTGAFATTADSKDCQKRAFELPVPPWSRVDTAGPRPESRVGVKIPRMERSGAAMKRGHGGTVVALAACLLMASLSLNANDFSWRASTGQSALCDLFANGYESSGATGCAACFDSVQNNAETGIDCGGPLCARRCGAGQGCQVGGDCLDVVCTGGLCQAASCTDGVANGMETDVDCGGGSCPRCAAGQQCLGSQDCQSLVCAQQVCQMPSCSDGVRNGSETDVDCGGGSCPGCAVGKQCAVAADCLSGLCLGGICSLP